jgi:hypothetical protein
LSILQVWLEKYLDEPVQFKAKLQFGKAHQPIKTYLWISFKDKEYSRGCKELTGYEIP